MLLLILLRTSITNFSSLFVASVVELWRAFGLFLSIFQGALLEIWKHMTRENLNTIVALAILVYTLPDILDVVKELMKKNVVLWGSKSTLKG